MELTLLPQTLQLDLMGPTSKGRERKDRGGEGREGKGERGEEGKGEGEGGGRKGRGKVASWLLGGWTPLEPPLNILKSRQVKSLS